jgi:nucleoside 2-deoxyribosyltransferase
LSSSHIETTKFYLVSKIKESQHRHNESLAKFISGHSFIPHLNNPFNILHSKLEYSVFKMDLDAMIDSDFGAVSLPIGSDCSAEIGWFCGNNKPVYAYIYDSGYGMSCEDQYKNLSSRWMVKGFLTGVVVIDNQEVFDLAKEDPILKDKIEHYTSE